MAHANCSIRLERGDIPLLNEEPGLGFFIVYVDGSFRAYVVVDDERWVEAEAFARIILDTIAKRRAAKAQTAEVPA
jgi:hypothetical protein